MKQTLIVAAVAALLALPASAQQGPAGVPGAPGLAPVNPRPLAEPVAEKAPPLRAVRKKTSKEPPQAAAAGDCAKDPDPARCRLFQKTRGLCQDKLGEEHRQCLRDQLAPGR